VATTPTPTATTLIKNVKGRKRHLLVDTLGVPLSVYVTPANVQDRVGARLLLAGLAPLVPRLEKIWAEGAYGDEPRSHSGAKRKAVGIRRSWNETERQRVSRSYRRDGS